MSQHVTTDQQLAVYSRLLNQLPNVPFPQNNMNPYHRGVPEQYEIWRPDLCFSSRRKAESREANRSSFAEEFCTAKSSMRWNGVPWSHWVHFSQQVMHFDGRGSVTMSQTWADLHLRGCYLYPPSTGNDKGTSPFWWEDRYREAISNGKSGWYWTK